MALSKYTGFLLDTNTYFAQDLFLAKLPVSETNKNRYKDGEFHTMYQKIRKSEKDFFEYTGMSIKTFDYILENVREVLKAGETNYNLKNIISVEEKLMVAFR